MRLIIRPWQMERRWPVLVLLVGIVVAAVAGASLGYYLRLDLPDVNKLDDYSPPVITTVLADNGSVLDTFAEQRRIMIGYQDIPEVFKQALIAVEDASFYDHAGLSFQGIMRAAWRNVSSMRTVQGASTLTQQLARNLFLHPDKTFRRKFQEAMLALEIERQYTKDEILRFYCNQVYMGHGRYGLEAASRFYLGKPAREVDLPEAAMLAGLIQRPEAISPFKNPDRARSRRNHVLERMVIEGYISEADAADARLVEPPSRTQARQRKLAPYFVEEIRRWVQGRYGDSNLYRAGLRVRTTLDPRMQKIANHAMDSGLRQLDKRQGWRGPHGRVPEDQDPAEWRSSSWDAGIQPGDVVDGVVLETGKEGTVVRVGDHGGTLGQEQLAWTARRGKTATFETGDIVRVGIVSIAEDGSVELTLEQDPAVEAALVAIEPRTGAVRALVGGFDFERSEFDRAIQARRQSGSAFKPFVFAAALSNGWTLADTLVDEATVFLDPRQPTPYLPRNYKRNYYGSVTLRRALEKSANVATVELLNQVGAREVIDVAKRLGITTDLRPYPSLALGAFEVSLLELTAAYGTFANQGVRVEPHLVEEVRGRSGELLYQVEPEVHDVLSPEIAHLMNRMLHGVITDGTGRAAKDLDIPLAGKTGTTDGNTDAWFLGYSPELVVGVWVGFDAKVSLGDRETGALAALPIWRTFMQEVYEGVPVEDFRRPDATTVVVIDRDTGLRANPSADCVGFSETFVRGTEPTRYCSVSEHKRLKLPYPFHRFPLDEQGVITIPELDLQELLENEPLVYLAERGTRLEYYSETGTVSLPLRIVPGGGTQPLPESILAMLEEQEEDPESWIGTDGRKPRVRFFRY